LGCSKIYYQKEMKEIRYDYIIKLMFYLYILTVLSLMLFSINVSDINVPKEIMGIAIDKVVHFFIFFPYPFLLYVSFKRKFTANLPFFLWIIIPLSGIFFAIATEFLQSLNPARSFELSDMAANVSAIVSASIISNIFHYFHVWSRRLQ
jgi:VanZ family protein